MLATGMRSPLGLKIAGPNLERIQELGIRVEELLREVRGTRSLFAERTNDGRYIDIQWDRAELARAGISMDEAQTACGLASGRARGGGTPYSAQVHGCHDVLRPGADPLVHRK
jgi:copper/silver efflux system protein